MKYKKQVSKSHYDFDEYLNQERWISYFHQIYEVVKIAKKLKKKSLKILEIGIGDKTVSSILETQGMRVTTMDIDSQLNPDMVGSLPNIPVKAKQKFDCIICSQVLEHVAYKDSEKTLSNMSGIAKYAVISVPHKSITLSLTMKLWFFKTFRIFVFMKSPKKFDSSGQHYWELGAKSFSVKRFRKSIRKTGFKIIGEHRVPEFPYHHFFVLKSNLV